METANWARMLGLHCVPHPQHDVGDDFEIDRKCHRGAAWLCRHTWHQHQQYPLPVAITEKHGLKPVGITATAVQRVGPLGVLTTTCPSLPCCHRYLLQQSYGGGEQPDICILTPYVGQLLRLRKAFAAVSDVKFVMSDKDATDLNHVVTDAAAADSPFDLPDPDEDSNSSGSSSLPAGAGSKVVSFGRSVRLATIDNFQGEEGRIIILSLTRNPREHGAGIGFLAVDNRINVLLSR